MTKILLTVDVEDPYFPGDMKRIWGKVENNYYGIPKIVEILKRYNFKATFFVDVYENKIHGDKKMREVLRFLNEAEQDVQLHTHPGVAGRWGKGGLSGRPLLEQIDIIKYGKVYIEDIINREVIAHRAGSYSIDDTTLEALCYNNIKFDSSLFYKSSNCKISKVKGLYYNDILTIENIIELPITSVRFSSLLKNIILKIDIEYEINFLKKSIMLFKSLDYQYLTFFMHSFSFLVSYSRSSCPNKKNIKKFINLLEFLRENDISVVTFREIDYFNENCNSIKTIPYLNLDNFTLMRIIKDRILTEIHYRKNKTWIEVVKRSYGF